MDKVLLKNTIQQKTTPPPEKERVVLVQHPMAKLLALDQSSKVTGIAIFEDGKLLKYSKLDLKNPNLAVRLVEFRNSIKNIIKEEQITEVIFEDI